MNKSFTLDLGLNGDSPASDLDTTLERNISNVIDILENEDSVNSDTDKNTEPILKGVRAYVEVRTNNDNRSEAVSGMLKSHGAVVEKTFTNEVTHVIFKDGSKRTVDKAKKKGIHLVSVLWVDSCLRNGRCVSEQMYPAILPQKEKSTPVFFKKNRLKKMKSMQPNDFEHDVAKSSERYDKKRKKEEERLGLSGCSTPVASPIILAYDTVPRSPPSPSDWRSPIPLVIPATPPSIKDTVNRLRQARLNNSAGSDCSATESPQVGDLPNLPPLHRKLFDGNEGMKTPSFDISRDDHETSHTDSVQAQNKSLQDNEETTDLVLSDVDSPGMRILKSFDNSKQNDDIDSAVLLKRKLFNVLDKNSPKPYLLEPVTHCGKGLPTLVESPIFNQKNSESESKFKGQKRKAETDSGNSGKQKNIKKKSKETNSKNKMKEPIKNIYAEYSSGKSSAVNSDLLNDLVDSSETSKGNNSEQTSQKSNSHHSSRKSRGSTSSLNSDDVRRSSRRVSIATPDSPVSLVASLRRSSRRASMASLNSISETDSPDAENVESSTKSINSRRKSRVSEKHTRSLTEQDRKILKGSISAQNSESIGSNSSFKASLDSKNKYANDLTPSLDGHSRNLQNGTSRTPNSETLSISSSKVRHGRRSLVVKEHTPNSHGHDDSISEREIAKSSEKVIKRGRKSLAAKVHTPTLETTPVSNGINTTNSEQESENSPAKVLKRGRKSVVTKDKNLSFDRIVPPHQESNSEPESNPNSLIKSDKNNSEKVPINRRKSVRLSALSNSKENTPLSSDVESGPLSNRSKERKESKKRRSSKVAKESARSTPECHESLGTEESAHPDISFTEKVKRRSSKAENNNVENLSHNPQTLRVDNSTHPDISRAETSGYPATPGAETSGYPDTPGRETSRCLGASMSAVFGDVTMPSFSQAPARRSIDDFKPFNRKKNTNTKALSSITENEQKSPSKKSKRNSRSSKNSMSKKRNKISEKNTNSNASYEIHDCDKPSRTNVKLRRANSFLQEKITGDTMGKITRPSIVMTSMHSYEQEAVISVIKKLGGFLLVDNVCETTTHVVCGDSRRTLNLVNGVARGCWVLKKEWVLKSLDNGSWLNEEDYEFCDVYPQVKVNRKERQIAGIHYTQTIFTGIGVIFISPKSSPPKSSLISLIKLCGGEITGSASRCDIFIGNEANSDKTSIKPVWVLDCIMEHRLIDYDQPKYILNLNHTIRESSPEF